MGFLLRRKKVNHNGSRVPSDWSLYFLAVRLAYTIRLSDIRYKVI